MKRFCVKFMNQRLGFISVIIILLLTTLMSCSGHRGRTLPSGNTTLDSLKATWNRYNDLGYYDSLICTTRPFFRKALAEADTYALVNSGLYIAQAFMSKENTDSVNKYLDIVSEYSHTLHDARLNALVNNVLGIYQLKMRLDYSRALSYFQKAYRYAEQLDNAENEIILLANIVYIFYIRHDRNGMVYAQKALDISENNRLEDFTRTLSYVLMAQMHYVAGDYARAEKYVALASDVADDSNLLSLVPTLELIHGDLHAVKGTARDCAEADSCYRRALEYKAHAMPGLQTLIYLNYGRLCKNAGERGRALALYRHGLDICNTYGNVECRGELLKEMSDTYYCENEPDSSLAYYRAYHAYADSMDNIRREQDFNRLLMSYQEIEHQNLMQAKELDLLKARKRMLLIASVLAVITVIAIALVVLVRRQKKMYKLLVSQHQKFVQRMNMINETALAEPKEDEVSEEEQKSTLFKELFLKMDNMVRSEKLYCQNDISLERVAEILGTNRTYVSKAINMCAGMTFHKYVNMLRIADATAALSDPQNEKPLKQLADELGFSSVSVFYKTFQRETGCTASIYRKTVKNVQNTCDDS